MSVVLPRGCGAVSDRFGHLPCPDCHPGEEEEGRRWHRSGTGVKALLPGEGGL